MQRIGDDEGIHLRDRTRRGTGSLAVASTASVTEPRRPRAASVLTPCCGRLAGACARREERYCSRCNEGRRFPGDVPCGSPSSGLTGEVGPEQAPLARAALLNADHPAPLKNNDRRIFPSGEQKRRKSAEEWHVADDDPAVLPLLAFRSDRIHRIHGVETRRGSASDAEGLPEDGCRLGRPLFPAVDDFMRRHPEAGTCLRKRPDVARPLRRQTFCRISRLRKSFAVLDQEQEHRKQDTAAGREGSRQKKRSPFRGSVSASSQIRTRTR